MYLAISIYVLFISLMQAVNGVQVLNTTSLLTLSDSAGASTCATVIVPFYKCICLIVIT